MDFGIALSLTVRKFEQFCEHSCADDVRVNRHPYRVGQGVEDSLYRDVLNRWMEQRPHDR